MPFDATFDARTVQPQQGGGAHPVGNKFPFTITNTEVAPTKDGKGGLFNIEFTSPVGSIVNRYNLWNENETARKIAQQELSALCHATGIFQIDFKNDGAALRGAKGLMDVAFQKGQEPSAEKPQGGYVELKKVYDVNGNEPGKNAAPQQQANPPQQQAQQHTPNGGGGWGGTTQNTASQANSSPSWGQQSGAPAPGNTPPWGR